MILKNKKIKNNSIIPKSVERLHYDHNLRTTKID